MLSVCDKCDGKHETAQCPHYPYARDDGGSKRSVVEAERKRAVERVMYLQEQKRKAEIRQRAEENSCSDNETEAEQTPVCIRFNVHDVKPNKERMPKKGRSLEKSWESIAGEIMYQSPLQLRPGYRMVQTFTDHNAFAQAVNLAFYCHYPLRISPDIIWITILQGLAIHIDRNQESLRSKFVDFDGKEKITVIRMDILPEDGQNNNWPASVDDFMTEIRQRVRPNVRGLTDCTFLLLSQQTNW